MIKVRLPRTVFNVDYYLEYCGSRVNYILQDSRFLNAEIHRPLKKLLDNEERLFLKVALFDDITYSVGMLTGNIYQPFDYDDEDGVININMSFSPKQIILSDNISFIEGEINHEVMIGAENINDSYLIKIFVEKPSLSLFNKILRESDCHYLDFE